MIGTLELAYYDSLDNAGGADPLIDNSEMRCLIGYNRNLARGFNAGLQYYMEQLLDYGQYEASLNGNASRDRFRHVVTLQLSLLLMNQNLELSLSAYYSPSDEDAYLRPKIGYAVSDSITLETGANVFTGEERHTFFGQFEKNTNIYAAVRFNL